MGRPANLGWLAGGLSLVAVALAVVAIVLANKNSTLDHRIDTLRTAVQKVQHPNGATTGLKQSLSTLQHRLKIIEDCIPELETQLTSDTYDTASNSIYPTSQVSHFCSNLVYGTSGG